MADRVFTEEEVKEIVRRASEQQAEDAERHKAREHGLTLADLERLGAEVGLDPAYLRRAADEVQTGRRAVTETETKTDTHVIVERRLDRAFSPEAWEDTVHLLRQRFGMSMGTWYGQASDGRVEQVGRAHEWSHVSGLGIETRVSVSERDGALRLILSQRVGQASSKVEGTVIAAVIGLVLGVFAAIGIGDAYDSIGLFLAAWLAVTTLITVAGAPVVTRIESAWREKKLGGLKNLAADIEQIFEDAAPHIAEPPTWQADASPRTAEPATAGRIDLDALPDEPDTADASARNRERS